MSPEITTVQQQTYLAWMIQSLGGPCLMLLLMSSFLSIIVSLVIVVRGKGPMATAALLLVVHSPFWVGLFFAITGGINSFRVIATSPVSPKPSELAEGISTALFSPLAGLLLMVPGYLIAGLGSFIRSMKDRDSVIEESHIDNL
ncbi:MotA/TolQ/ExbB proton channel family protein [Thalassoglobus sp.]|uniref:MotA/TolQ/ExbB proton channel family protein n=1 Tax=Thalassoglobus sp. TaxID=2795869 RepID=UPI003AA9CC89